MNAAMRSQEKSITRINNMINDLRREGYDFNKNFLNSLKVSGTSASKAAAKAERLKGISKADLRQKITSYRTDEGKILKGTRAREEGPKIERAKKRRARKEKVTTIINVEDAISDAVDEVWINEDGSHVSPGEQQTVTAIKQSVINAWEDYRDSTPVNEMDLSVLNAVHEALIPMNDHSQTVAEYDSNAQRVISLLTGAPVNPDDIGNDESMEDIT